MKSVDQQKTIKNSFWVQAFDVMFIMLLCFIILLTTMMMRGKVLVGSGSTGGIDYSFNLPVFLILVLALGTYLFYVISSSDKELRTMIENRYDKSPRKVR